MSSEHPDAAWFFVVVEGDVVDEGLIGQQCYYAQRSKLGEALDCARVDAANEPVGLQAVTPVYVAIVDEAELEGDLYETDFEGLIQSDGLYVRPQSEGRSFHCPVGVVPSGWQPDGVDRDSMTEGFIAERNAEYFSLEAQVQNDSCCEILESLISALPSVDSLVVMILDHYDSFEFLSEPLEQNHRHCLIKDLGGPVSEALSCLNDLDTNVLRNGHVDFGVNCEAADCTIWLTEHKTLNIVTTVADVHKKMADVLGIRLRELQQLQSFSNCFGHYHYREAGSLPEDGLVQWLRSEGWTTNDQEQ